MWPFTKKPPRDRHDGYEPPPPPPETQDPWAAPAIVAQMQARVEAHLDEGQRLDGWKNELTGVGDFLRDKSLGGRRGGLEFEVNLITNVAAEARWRGSDLGARVVETIPDEMTREGWDVEVQPSTEDDEEETVLDAFGAPAASVSPPVPKPLDIDDAGIEVAEELDGILETLGADQAFWKALCYERAYGGGAVLLGANDGFIDDMAKPLDEKRIKSVDWLNVLSGGWDGEVVAWSYYQDPTKPNYGMPETYMVRNLGVPLARIPAPGEPSLQPVLPPNGATVWWVHESRLLLFSGVAVSHRARVQVRGWGDSVFTRVDEVLQQYGQTWGGIANLMTDFSQAILSIKGLAQSIAGNKGVVSSRALQANISRSIARILLIDSEEEFKRDTVSLAGVAEVLQQFALRLAAASGMPLSLLMGQVQGGLGDASAGDIRYFYDRVASWQRRRMLPQLRRLIKLIFLSKDGPTNGVEPERWSVKCRPLYQMTVAEKSAQYLQMAQGDQIYQTMGAVSAEEVAAKRFGGSDYDAGPIVLDLEGRGLMGAADPVETDPNAPPADASAIKLSISPQMQAGITTVNEARAKMGLGDWGDPDGELSINEFLAKHSGVTAQAANTQKGVVGDPQSVEEQAAAKAEEAKARFGHWAPGKGSPPPGAATAAGEEGKEPSTGEAEVSPPAAKKDEFDPDQPREEDGKWLGGGAGSGSAGSESGGGGGGGGGSSGVVTHDPAQHKENVASRMIEAKGEISAHVDEIGKAVSIKNAELAEKTDAAHDKAKRYIDEKAKQAIEKLPKYYHDPRDEMELGETKKTSSLIKRYAEDAKGDLPSKSELRAATRINPKYEIKEFKEAAGEAHRDFKNATEAALGEHREAVADAHREHEVNLRDSKELHNEDIAKGMSAHEAAHEHERRISEHEAERDRAVSEAHDNYHTEMLEAHDEHRKALGDAANEQKKSIMSRKIEDGDEGDLKNDMREFKKSIDVLYNFHKTGERDYLGSGFLFVEK